MTSELRRNLAARSAVQGRVPDDPSGQSNAATAGNAPGCGQPALPASGERDGRAGAPAGLPVAGDDPGRLIEATSLELLALERGRELVDRP